VNARSGEAFQAGIGPHSEASAVKLIAGELEHYRPGRYKDLVAIAVPYSDRSRQKCDLCIGRYPDWDWAIEIMMLRRLGDNGKVNDNILMHILSPYPEHRSALTDCAKLAGSSMGNSKAILIYGFEQREWPLEPAIGAFETLARARTGLGPRHEATFRDLVHPFHNQGCVFGWQVGAEFTHE
jgi:hypothetical protein